MATITGNFKDGWIQGLKQCQLTDERMFSPLSPSLSPFILFLVFAPYICLCTASPCSQTSSLPCGRQEGIRLPLLPIFPIELPQYKQTFPPSVHVSIPKNPVSPIWIMWPPLDQSLYPMGRKNLIYSDWVTCSHFWLGGLERGDTQPI